MLRVGRDLDAERPADVVGDDVNPGFRDPERPGQRREQGADALRRRPDRVPAVPRLVLGHHPAGLHRGDDHPVVGDGEPGDVGRARERIIGGARIAAFPVEGDVAGGGRPEPGGARIEGRAAVDHHVERLVVDHDPLGRFLRGPARVRDDHRHRVADVHRPLSREQRMRDVDGLLAVAARHPVRLAQRCDAVRLQIGAREHREDPRRCRRLRGVDGDDPRMCMGRAHDPRMGLMGALDVVDEPAPPAEQGGVFAPRDARADGGDERACHFVVLPGIRCGSLSPEACREARPFCHGFSGRVG